MTVLLTRRAVVQAQIEDVYGVPETLTINDGVLVSEPTFEVDTNVLERTFTRDSLSPQAHIVGRKIASMTFQTELRGNSKQQSGILSDAPILARLMRACGYTATAFTAPYAKGPYDVNVHLNEVAWTSDVTAADNTIGIAYYVEVTTGGASGVAEVTITSDTAGEGSSVAPVAATGSIVFAGQPADASTITLNGEVWTFVAGSPASGQTQIGANLAATLTALVSDLNGSGNPNISAATYSANTTTLSITHDTPGTTGNSYTLTASGGSQGTPSGGSLAGGAAASGGVVITTGVDLDLGTHGLILTPTFTGNLQVGQQWIVWLIPKGIALTPISDNFESITLAMYKDGVKHLMPGAFGTFEITATAGEFATVDWTFTGIYRAPIDETMPSPVYERTLPSQVELAKLRLHDFYAIVEEFTFDQGNDIQIRPDVSSPEGYIGTRIVARAPEGGINPEADRVANYDFWNMMSTASRMPFQMRVGYNIGNTVWIIAPGSQYTGLTYADRNGILTYDAGLKFSAYNSDDEVGFYFC